MRAVWDVLRFALGALVPRFVTEDVAMRLVGDDPLDARSYEIVCSMDDVRPGEVFDAVAEVDGFTWLTIGLAYRVGNFRPWGFRKKSAA